MARIDLLPSEKKENYYQVDNWGPQHQMMTLMRAAGKTVREIAAITDYNPATVSKILSDPRAIKVITETAKNITDLTPDVLVKLKLAANEAVDEIIDELRNCEDPKVRQRAAFGLLDRAGYSPVRKEIRASASMGEVLSDELLKSNIEALEESNSIEANYRTIDTEPMAEGQFD